MRSMCLCVRGRGGDKVVDKHSFLTLYSHDGTQGEIQEPRIEHMVTQFCRKTINNQTMCPSYIIHLSAYLVNVCEKEIIAS